MYKLQTTYQLVFIGILFSGIRVIHVVSASPMPELGMVTVVANSQGLLVKEDVLLALIRRIPSLLSMACSRLLNFAPLSHKEGYTSHC